MLVSKRSRKSTEQPTMDKSEIRAILGARHTMKTNQNQKRNTENLEMGYMDPTKIQDESRFP